MKELSIEKLLKNKENPKLILEAFEFAKEIYKDKKRLSGENYIHHALRVALFLDKMGLDQKTLIVALLHDAIDDKPISMQESELKEIEKRFSVEVADLVKKVSDLRKIRFSLENKIKEKKNFTKEKIENLRKTFIALAGDLRVLLIELVSRLDGLEHLASLSEEQRKIYALETLEIFVPIANRLGLGEIKRLLEDGSFFYLFGDKYKWIQNNTKEKYEEKDLQNIKLHPGAMPELIFVDKSNLSKIKIVDDKTANPKKEIVLFKDQYLALKKLLSIL